MYFGIFVVFLIAAIAIFFIFRNKVLPLTEKQLQLKKWEDSAKASRLFLDLQGNDRYWTPCVRGDNLEKEEYFVAEWPMAQALRVRNRVAQLINSGHGISGKGLLDDIDSIIETVYALQQSMEVMPSNQIGKRTWHYSSPNTSPWNIDRLIFTWCEGRATELKNECYDAIKIITDIEKKITEICKGGLSVTKEEIMLKLQVRTSDNMESQHALEEAFKEIELRPL